ncbi:hypothetical protein PHMEG_00032429 [Phytophthora megakarya]|uniref:Uncharacterized protein n=1 Tax=Phytophthora megakarya TaxID=4795 RepID=A0A225UVR2_9STRA|nr:hypothetical protein PHMEG_00032429 [Phytophthora megakarya]
MPDRMKTTLQRVDLSNVRVNATTLEIVFRQIRNGDLYVENNEYIESGQRIRIVSTSQLDAVHRRHHNFRKLFNLLREKGTIKKQTHVFCNVFDLAACMCPTLTRKSKIF